LTLTLALKLMLKLMLMLMLPSSTTARFGGTPFSNSVDFCL